MSGDATAQLTSLFRPSGHPRPVLLLGAGASFRSGVPLARDAIDRIARIAYSKQVLGTQGPSADRIPPSDWSPWLRTRPWFIDDRERYAENFPLAVEHLLTPAAFRKNVLMQLMQPANEISEGYHILASFVLRGLTKTILTTNFDPCLPTALEKMKPHLREICEVNRFPDDYDQFNIYNRCQIIWLHGRIDFYSDRIETDEIDSLSQDLKNRVRPIVRDSPIIVIGYRGAEPSIMDGLFGKDKPGRLDFQHGIYWCVLSGENIHPNVQRLQDRIGKNFELIQISGFDELFSGLKVTLADADSLHSPSINIEHQATTSDDTNIVKNAKQDHLDMDLVFSTLKEYCTKLDRPAIARNNLENLMRELRLLIRTDDGDQITVGALLLFGVDPQRFFPEAIIELTQDGKKREIFDGNLISIHRRLLARVEQRDLNPIVKVKGITKHKDRPTYPKRALVELVVNMIVHRNYRLNGIAKIDILSGNKIRFENPGSLKAELPQHVSVDSNGIISLDKPYTHPHNPTLCDIFYGLSAVEKAGTGLIDVLEMMRQSGGRASFYSRKEHKSFTAEVQPPESSAGSNRIFRSDVSAGVYILNALPFVSMPDTVSILTLKQPISSAINSLQLEGITFVPRDLEILSFVHLDKLIAAFAPIVDGYTTIPTQCYLTNEVTENRKMMSWLIRKHFERHISSFKGDGLIIESRNSHRAYFCGTDRQPRTIAWSSSHRSNIKREVVKARGQNRSWFENEGISYEVVLIDECWCIQIKPFYMFTQDDAKTPLPRALRTSRSTRRIKYDRNRSVEADLNFWASFLSRGLETINIGQDHVKDLFLLSSFVTVEVPDIGV